MGYIKTSRARSRIQHWFRQENYAGNVAIGRQILEKELHRMALHDVSFDKLAKKLKFNKVDDMFAMLADGEFKASRAAAAAQELIAPEVKDEERVAIARERKPSKVKGEFKIHGVGNLLTQMGNCCNPVPGDPIVGFITRGRGVTIHRQDCANVLHQRTEAPERLIEVDWGLELGETYPVDIVVTAYDRHGLLRDITSLLADARINVIALNTVVDKKEHLVVMTLTMEVTDIQEVSRVLSKIGQLGNIIDARRRTH